MAVQHIAAGYLAGGGVRRHDRAGASAFSVKAVHQHLLATHVAQIKLFLRRGHERRVKAHGVAVHVDGKGGGRAALYQLLLGQHKGERRRPPATVLLGRGQRRVPGLLEPGDIFKGKAAVAVMLLGPCGKLDGERLGKGNNALLLWGKIKEHGHLP